MTITVTIEELKAYEGEMRKWSLARAGNYATLLEQEVRRGRSLMEDRPVVGEVISRSMKQWEAENPIPKLIPAL